jgi:hypothetical protein
MKGNRVHSSTMLAKSCLGMLQLSSFDLVRAGTRRLSWTPLRWRPNSSLARQSFELYAENTRRLGQPVTSRTSPTARGSPRSAVAVCGAISSCSTSAFGVSTGERRAVSCASGRRERRSHRVARPLPCPALRRHGVEVRRFGKARGGR